MNNFDKAWNEAKKVVKKEMKKEIISNGGIDASKMHRIAAETIKRIAPETNDELAGNAAWQIVLILR
jgi:O-phosphoseryl-tRNA(Cys) synthetase